MAEQVKVSVFYVGSSLLAPLRLAEKEICADGKLDIRVAAHNCGLPFDDDEWATAESDMSSSDIVFVIHVTEGETASRILSGLEKYRDRHRAVIAFNCMPELMRRTRMGKLDFAALMKSRSGGDERSGSGFARKLGLWMAETMKRSRPENPRSKGRTGTRPVGENGRAGADGKARRNGRKGTNSYLDLIARLPKLLRFVPGAGRVADIKNYLLLFCYFLQPTPANIRSMLLCAIGRYVPGYDSLKFDGPESMPSVGIYHPDSPSMFDSYAKYKTWYERTEGRKLVPDSSVGLLLMRPQIVSRSRRHYDSLIRAIERQGLAVVPAISTFMDNRDACERFFVGETGALVSQVVSLTGFSFVGGPAMNDSEAAVEFLKALNIPLRSLVSLDVQTIESWEQSKLGLNPIQTAMQVSIPEIDGATEPFVFGGLASAGVEPAALEERCERIARRLARWNRLRVAPRNVVRLALVLFCFPPDKGNVGTAADLDVFASLNEILLRLKSDGYAIECADNDDGKDRNSPVAPKLADLTADALREMLLGGNSVDYGTVANVAYRMNADEYRRLCPYVADIEREWGPAPGTINASGDDILIPGIHLGNVFIAIQPTFGYEGDPMRLLMSESGCPHHGFMGLYTYLEKVFRADAVVHVGTHGSLEFMPGKQVGLSSRCWPDRLVGELPNIYLYSVNNPAEGTIAKRRSYAELVSYATPPVENAGLYKGLASLKELVQAYRTSANEAERARLFELIEPMARELRL